MSRFLTFCLLVAVLATSLAGCQAPPAPTAVPPTPTPEPPTLTPAPPTPTTAEMVSKLRWFGTSAFLYRGSKTIYFDPVALAGDLPPADVILVTHAHSDHWSPADIKKIIGPNTVLIISPNVKADYEAHKADLGIAAKVLDEGQTAEANGVNVKAVAAYANDGFHPREGKGMGYIVTVDGGRIYNAGATDAYTDMAQYQCEVALIPVYTKERAAALVAAIPAKTFVLDHTSIWVIPSFITLLSKDLDGQKTFATVEAAPSAH